MLLHDHFVTLQAMRLSLMLSLLITHAVCETLLVLQAWSHSLCFENIFRARCGTFRPSSQ